MIRKLLPLLTVGIGAVEASAQDPEAMQKAIDALRQRVDELEEQQMKTEERIGDRALLQAYTAKSLDLGGHVTSQFTSMRGEERTESGHFATLIELYVRARLDDRWSLFATPGFYTYNGAFLDDPATAPQGDPSFLRAESMDAGASISRAYGQFDVDDRLQVCGGVLGTPHGTNNREYFIPARIVQSGHLHTRYFQSNSLYPQQVTGLQAAGKTRLGDDLFEYAAYVGVEDDSAADTIGGARAALVLGEQRLTIAANYGRGTREGFTPGAPGSAAPFYTGNVAFAQAPFPIDFNLTRDYQFGGVDVELRAGGLTARTEAYYSGEADVADQRAFSQELNWFAVDDFAVSYRFGYYDSGADLDALGLAVVPRGHATEHVVGFCYTPLENVRLRLDLHHLELPASDDAVDFVNLSWSLSF